MWFLFQFLYWLSARTSWQFHSRVVREWVAWALVGDGHCANRVEALRAINGALSEYHDSFGCLPLSEVPLVVYRKFGVDLLGEDA
jgi:hypothetical protein